MNNCLASFLVAACTGTRVLTPRGGLFVWLRLPGKLSSKDLFKFAVEEGVSFSPGTFFFADDSGGEGRVRLNFSVQTPEMIRLRKAIERMAPGVGRE